MKIFILLTILSVTIVSCENSTQVRKAKTFNEFDFSYNNFFTTCFSIKFKQDDTVFIQQHFAAFSDTLKSNKTYFAILSNTEKQTLDSFINKMNFALYDTSYCQPYEDGDYYQFSIANDTLQKTIFVHSDSIPKELKAFGYWIVATKEKLKHFPIDTMVVFGSLKHFLPPTVPPPPTIKFKPPKVK
jgi:hypothetical protein